MQSVSFPMFVFVQSSLAYIFELFIVHLVYSVYVYGVLMLPSSDGAETRVVELVLSVKLF